MGTNVSKLSNNDLNEILTCLNRISNELNDNFSHIEEFVSKGFKDSLNKEIGKFVAEEEKRYN